jgi:hypothetical protein
MKRFDEQAYAARTQFDLVCQLVQQGELDEARRTAASIAVEHLRAEALKIANFSTRFAGAAA